MPQDNQGPYLLEVYTPQETIELHFDALDWQAAERVATYIASRAYPNAPYCITHAVTHDDMSTESVTWQPGDPDAEEDNLYPTHEPGPATRPYAPIEPHDPDANPF